MENQKEVDSNLEEVEKDAHTAEPENEKGSSSEEKIVGSDDQENESESSENDGSEENDLNGELVEAKDKFLRLYSEFENFRRRTAREKIDLIGTASKELMISLLPVLDDFERALKVKESGEAGEDKGLELIYHKLVKVLEGKGLKKMTLKQGDKFDPEFHEAITQIPAPKKKLEGKIVDIIEPGYYLNEKVIRFAKVVTGAKG